MYINKKTPIDINNISIPTFVSHKVRSFNVNNKLEDNVQKAYVKVMDIYYREKL